MFTWMMHGTGARTLKPALADFVEKKGALKGLWRLEAAPALPFVEDGSLLRAFFPLVLYTWPKKTKISYCLDYLIIEEGLLPLHRLD